MPAPLATCVVSFDLASFGGAALEDVPAVIEAADAPDGTASTWFTTRDGVGPAYHRALSDEAGRVTFPAVPRGQWVRVKCPSLGLNQRFAVPNQSSYLLDPADFPAPTATTRAASGVDIKNYIDYVTDEDGWAPAIEAAIEANPGRKLIATAGTYTIKRTVYVDALADSLWLELEPGARFVAEYPDGETQFGMAAPLDSNYWMSTMFYFRNVECDTIRIDGCGEFDLNGKCHMVARIDNTDDASNRTDVFVGEGIRMFGGYSKVTDDPESNVGGIMAIGALGVVDIRAESYNHGRQAGSSENFATGAVNTTDGTITISSGNPLVTGRPVMFGTTGTLPGGITANTTVLYAIRVNSTTLKLASTRANAHAGTAITLSSQGTGTHTLYWGSAWPQSRVVMGHMIGDSTSDTYQPQHGCIRSPRIENIYSEDPVTHPFRSDCDGCLVFLDEDDDGTPNQARVSGKVVGARFRNCAGRFVKARGNVLIADCHGERGVAPIWPGWGGQTDWDLQTADGQIVNCTTVYDTYGSNDAPFNPAYHYCYGVKASSARAGVPCAPLVSGCRIVNRVSAVYGRLYAMAYCENATTDAIKAPIVRDLRMTGGATLFGVDCGRLGLNTNTVDDSLLVEGVRASHILVSVLSRVNGEATRLRLALRDVENHADDSTTFTALSDLLTLAANSKGAFQTGQLVRLSTTDALSGPETGTDYYWERVSDTTGYLHTSWRKALEGADPVTVGAGTGIHTIRTYTRLMFRNIGYQATTDPLVPAIGSTVVEGMNYGWYIPSQGPTDGGGTGIMAVNQAVALDGSAGVVSVASASVLNPGTADFSIGVAGTLLGLKARRGRIPLMYKTAAFVGYGLYVDGNDRAVACIGNGSSMTEYPSTEPVTVLATAHEKARVLAGFDRDGFVTFNVNDRQLGDPVAISAQSAQTASSAGNLQVGFDGTNYGIFDVDAFALFSGVVPVEAWTERGVPPAFQWGSFTPAWTANWSGGVDGATGTRLTSLTGNVDAVSDGSTSKNDTLRAIPNTDNNTHYWDKASIFTVGRSYRVRFYYYIESGNTKVTGIKMTGDNGYSIPDAYFGVQGAWTLVEMDIVAGSTGLRFYARSGGSVTFAGDGLEAFYIQGLTVECLGAVLYCSPLTLQSHSQWLDASSNRSHALLSNTGATPRVPRSDGVIYATIAASGNSELLGSGVYVLPENCVIERILAKSSGTPDMTVGNSSGGAEYVASVALTSSWQNLTLVTPLNGSQRDVWIGLSTADSTDIVLFYRRLSL